MKGFFQTSEVMGRAPIPMIPKCGACGLYKTCKSPKMPVAGKGLKKILVLGEAPGETEDSENKPFVGKAGQRLRRDLAKVGIDLFRDCWVTNSLICRPGTDNRIKDKRAIGYCRPNVIKAVNEYKPDVIIPLGATAVESLIGWLWKEDTGGIARWVGWKIPCQKLNAWICPTYHPSYLEREENQVLDRFFLRHLKAAAALKGKPWETAPDYPSQVKRYEVVAEAASEIRRFCKRNRTVAFDYETDRSKPDHPGSQILCCSVSDGETTIAYPWHGEAIKATKELLLSDVGKVGSNILFEQRWTMRHLGVRVRNWQWDTMLAAHVLDNREKITGLKFQAFVLLGQESYDDAIKPFFQSEGGNGQNRFREINLSRLLKYCGTDSLCEILVAKRQAAQMGVEL